jgi:hypothetical protein
MTDKFSASFGKSGMWPKTLNSPPLLSLASIYTPSPAFKLTTQVRKALEK